MSMEHEIDEPKQADQEIPEGYKWTEVGVIPEDWDTVSLNQICSKFVHGGTPSTKVESYWTGNIPWITGADIVNQCIGKVRRFITNQAVQYSSTNIIDKGSLLVVTRTGVGKLAIAPFDLAISQDLTGVNSDSNKVDANFLFYFLNKNAIILSKLNQGTSINGITKNTLGKQLISLPPIKEQTAIAAALSDVDNLIESLDKLIAKKRAIKQATMQQLLTGKKRLPGFEGEWEVKRLGEVVNLYQPETISSNRFKAYGYPVYGANGFVGYFDECNHKNSQVIVTCRGSTCGTVNWTPKNSWITGNAMVLNSDNNKSVDKVFLYYLMLYQDLSVCITGSGQPQIVRQPLSDYRIFYTIRIK